MITHPFVMRRRVRFGDCDPGGILYTPRLSYFVIEAILDFLSARLGAPAERCFMEMGLAPPARAMSIEFLRMLAWDDELDIQVTVAELRTQAMTFAVVGYVAAEKAFTAQTTHVCVSLQSRRPIAIPDALRTRLLDPAGAESGEVSHDRARNR